MKNESAEVISAFTLKKSFKTEYFIGTKSGLVLDLKLYSVENSDLIYKSEGQITKIVHSYDEKFILIACQEQSAVLYNLKNKSFFKFREGHNGIITEIFLSKDNRVCVTFGSDGYLNYYVLGTSKEKNA